MVKDLHAEVTGRGPAVVLLHGQPGTAGDWQWVAPRLSREFTVIAPDRPGYGRTGGPATGFAGNAQALVGLLDQLGIERAILAGHSWAGGVALASAENHAERVAGLVLVASVGPGERMGWEDRLLAAPYIGELIAAVAIGGVGWLAASRRAQNLASRRFGPRARDAVVALGRMTGTGAKAWQSFVKEQRAMLAELDKLAPALKDITAPTAILNGSADRLVPPEVGESLRRAIPDATRRVIPGAGHLLPHDHPDLIADAVREVAARDQTVR